MRSGEARKIEESIGYLLKKHREADKNTYNESQEEKEKASIEKLQARSEKIREWLEENDEKSLVLSVETFDDWEPGYKKIEHDLWFDEMSRAEMIEYNIRDAELTLQLTTFNNNLTWKLLIILMRVGR